MNNIVVGMTGASGSIYGLRLIGELLSCGHQVSVLLTNAGRQVAAFETDLKLSDRVDECRRQLQEYFNSSTPPGYYAIDDFFAPIASGSSAPDAVVICPCSMGTAGRIAAGLSDNLLERVVDVALKENRPLVLVPRETPFNRIHLENLLRLSQAGATILPAMPGFYHQPQSLDDIVDFVVGKILDSLGVSHRLYKRWGADN